MLSSVMVIKAGLMLDAFHNAICLIADKSYDLLTNHRIRHFILNNFKSVGYVVTTNKNDAVNIFYLFDRFLIETTAAQANGINSNKLQRFPGNTNVRRYTFSHERCTGNK